MLSPELSSNKKNSEFFNLCECKAFELITNIAEINNLTYIKNYRQCRNHNFINKSKKDNWNLNEKILSNKKTYTFKEIDINKGEVLRYKYDNLLKIVVFNEIGSIQIIHSNDKKHIMSLNQFCLTKISNKIFVKNYSNNFGKFFYHEGKTLYSKFKEKQKEQKKMEKEEKEIRKYLGD